MIEKLIKITVFSWILLYLGVSFNILNQQYYYYNQTIITQQKQNQELSQKIKSQKEVIITLEDNNFGHLSIKEKFIVVAAEYNTDYRLPYAIACYETGNFTSKLWIESSNAGGMKCGDGWCAFENQLDGIAAMVRNLKKNYIDKGLDTLEEIQPIYCPNSDTWTMNVKEILNSLEEGEK